VRASGLGVVVETTGRVASLHNPVLVFGTLWLYLNG
jgi:hypothetical protein